MGQGGNTSRTKGQPTSMVDSKITRYALLLAFVALTAGGPALHHAPIFGLHSCDHNHAEHAHLGTDHAHADHAHADHKNAGQTNHSIAHADGQEPTAAESCECGGDHRDSQANESGLIGSGFSPFASLTSNETEGSGHACDGTCAVCQFFSSISFQATTYASAVFNEFSFSLSIVASVSQSIAPKHSYFERGPPAFFPIA